MLRWEMKWKEFDHFCNFTGCAIGARVLPGFDDCNYINGWQSLHMLITGEYCWYMLISTYISNIHQLSTYASNLSVEYCCLFWVKKCIRHLSVLILCFSWINPVFNLSDPMSHASRYSSSSVHMVLTYHLVMTNSLLWKITMLLTGKLTINL